MAGHQENAANGLVTVQTKTNVLMFLTYLKHIYSIDVKWDDLKMVYFCWVLESSIESLMN